MDSTETRLAHLRADIAAGTYTPDADAVAEAIVGWIARPEQFENAGRAVDDHGEAGGVGRFGSEARR